MGVVRRVSINLCLGVSIYLNGMGGSESFNGLGGLCSVIGLGGKR